MSEPSNIGKAVGGRAWVVNAEDHSRLMPIGCAGELLIEGPILAREYLNDPGKTAAAFIENPTWALPGSGRRRFYKTGDLVRYGCDGTINFVGRKDTQVKIRGQRIETGEIEHHLSTHPLIRHSVVLAPAAGPSGKRLVSVIVPDRHLGQTGMVAAGGLQVAHGEEKDEVVSQWQAFLRERVPTYMVPEAWLVINELPLSTSGKADRKALTRWVEKLSAEAYYRLAHSTARSAAGEDEPATDIEAKLQQIFGRVLNVPGERVEMSKSFMAIGGDSISAMQAVSKCRADGITIRTRDILRGKTIRELAGAAVPAKPALAVEDEEEVDVPFGLSPIQEMYFQISATPGSLASDRVGAYRFNQSFLLRLMKHAEPEDIVRGIEAILRRYSMLRARFQQDGSGRWTQRITNEVAKSYRFRRNAVRSQEEVESAISAAQTSLDIENGPMFSVDLMDRAGEDPLLFLVAHHLVIDLVSWRALLEDLEQFIESGSMSPTEPLSFQIWAKKQARHAEEHLDPASVLHFDVPAGDLDYWRMNGRPNTYGDVVRKSFTLSEAFTAKLFSKQLLLLSDDFGGLMIDWNDLLSLADLVRAFPASYSLW